MTPWRSTTRVSLAARPWLPRASSAVQPVFSRRLSEGAGSSPPPPSSTLASLAAPGVNSPATRARQVSTRSDTCSSDPGRVRPPAAAGTEHSIGRSPLSPRHSPLARRPRTSALRQLAQDRLENAAVPVVVHIHRGVEPRDRGELEHGAVLAPRPHLDSESRLQLAGEAREVERLAAGQAQRFGGLARLVHPRQHTHAPQIAAGGWVEALR